MNKMKWCYWYVLMSIALQCSLCLANAADDILGCGGFIESHAKINFSKVEVELLTKQGSLKDKTNCSPSNGYYFLPVTYNGEYVLKISPPPGWSFEPEQYDINFDGKNDKCSRGEDVNFVFKGFGITGKIIGINGNSKGVQIDLKSLDGTDVRKTQSNTNGIFYFTPVVPGVYTISVYREGWYFKKYNYDVTVSIGNTEIPENTFEVSGFDVSGSISNDSKQNIGFVLLIHKNEKNKEPLQNSNCDTTNFQKVRPINNNYASQPLCSVTTSANGKFNFKSIVPGQYAIQPYILNENVQFHIQPEYIEFEVKDDAIELNESFEITGFSVVGRVLVNENGPPISNAKVFLNGQHVATTNVDGTYILKNIKSDSYTITASAPDLQFDTQTVVISIQKSSVPDIVVSAFKVCGVVSSQVSYTVAITKHASTYHTQATSQKGTGEWCTYLPPGRYSIQVLTSSDDLAYGIQFFPRQQNIDVTSSPINDITFSQLRASVVGDIKCLSDDDGTDYCQSAQISLNHLDADGNRNGQVISTSLIDGKYSFSEVLPGTYEVSVPTDLLCWESNTLTLIVKSAEEIVPTFVHTGYLVSVASSHNSKMSYKFRATKTDKQASKEIFLSPGINSFCVDKFGTYDISFEGCHTYDSTSPISFKTGDGNSIAVKAIKHRNGVRILADTKSTFKVLIENEKKEKNYVNFKEEPTKVNGYFAYRQDFDLKPYEKLIISPQSDTDLFSPASKEVSGANDCVENALTFYATKGLIINGKVVPPIADVSITLTFNEKPDLTPIEVVTSADGRFKFGPLNGNLNVSLSAFKESYIFSEYDSENGEFKAHKLCEVIATVKDEHGNNLPGVLVSLSGAESYRKNLVAGEDGIINFHSLSPSQYYLRPMMKEYRFEPSSKIIDVKDGKTIRVELRGKRVAFSIFGSVSSLNDEPFSDIIVEARSEERCGHHQEESMTETTGKFRIRGLQPGCEYTIRVRSENENSKNLVDRTVPFIRRITVSNQDIHNINMVAISPLNYIDVIIRVTTSNSDYFKSLRVQLFKKGNLENPLYSQRIEQPITTTDRINSGSLVFLPRVPFDGKSYIVELASTLSEKHFKYALPTEQFEANRSTIYLELNFSPEIRLNANEFSENSFSAIILLGLVIIAFFQQDAAVKACTFLWNKLCNVMQAAINQTSSPKKKENRFEAAYNESEIDKIVQSINAPKKRNIRKT